MGTAQKDVTGKKQQRGRVGGALFAPAPLSELLEQTSRRTMDFFKTLFKNVNNLSTICPKG